MSGPSWEDDAMRAGADAPDWTGERKRTMVPWRRSFRRNLD